MRVKLEEDLKDIFRYIGEDPSREGLKATPKRIIKSWEHIFGGYKQSPADIFTVFDNDGSDGLKYNEIVLLRNIEFYSTCEHHMQPFFGKAHIAYIPKDKVVGISKLARLLEIYSRRLQIQERLCGQITNALMEYLDPIGAACILEAQHFCMVCRGVEKQNSSLITSSLKGAFMNDQKARQELMDLIKL